MHLHATRNIHFFLLRPQQTGQYSTLHIKLCFTLHLTYFTLYLLYILVIYIMRDFFHQNQRTETE